MSVIWITGLSGAGKTTIAKELCKRIRSVGEKVVLLDGDELREVLMSESTPFKNYDKDSRLNVSMQYARLCKLISDQDVTVVIATISLFHKVHSWNRSNISNYFEIYLKVPLEELKRRDTKGIYSKHKLGLIENVAGLDFAIEEPQNPDILIEFKKDQTIRGLVDKIILRMNERLKNEN